MIFVHRSAHPSSQVVFHQTAEAPPPKYSVWQEPDQIGLKMWWPGGDFDTSTGQGYSDAGRAFRRRIPEFVRHFQESEQGQGTVFGYSAAMFGLRDSVRIVGEHVLTEAGLRLGQRFPDAVAHGCFPLDSAAISKDSMPPYQIPYGCLLVKNLVNVLVAGRCFSATRIALSSARIMATCCLMGQAAGQAAVLAVKGGCPLRAVDPAEIRANLYVGTRNTELLKQRLTP